MYTPVLAQVVPVNALEIAVKVIRVVKAKGELAIAIVLQDVMFAITGAIQAATVPDMRSWMCKMLRDAVFGKAVS
jgi:hypothetical protein